MRFEHSKRTPYLSKRDQFRLAMMVILIGFVVFAINFAGRPESWYWLTGRPASAPTGDGDKRDTPRSPVSDEDIDFTPRVDSDPLPGRTVKIAPSEDEPRRKTLESDNPLFVTPEEIEKIQDNTLGIRWAERESYHGLLARARDNSLADQREAASDDIAFAVLMNESQQHLGRLITTKGEIRGLQTSPPGANDHGIDTLYEAWLFNADSGLNPYVIRTTSVPEGFPKGMQLESGLVVEVTGYFFKRYGYLTQDDRLHVAPMILAGGFKWHKPRDIVRDPDEIGLAHLVIGFAAVVGSVVIFMLIQFKTSDRRFEKEHLSRLTEAPAEAIAAIEGMPVIDVGESLRQMAESEMPVIATGRPNENPTRADTDETQAT